MLTDKELEMQKALGLTSDHSVSIFKRKISKKDIFFSNRYDTVNSLDAAEKCLKDYMNKVQCDTDPVCLIVTKIEIEVISGKNVECAPFTISKQEYEAVFNEDTKEYKILDVDR